MHPVIRAVVVALAYFASARVGYLFAIPNGLVTLWPPSGVMLGLLVLSRRQMWPITLAGGLAGSLASDLVEGYSVLLAIGAALANNVESLSVAWLLTRRLGQPVRLQSLRAVLEFVIGGAVLANAMTASLGALMLHLGFRTPLPTAWFVWWVGDGLGMLIVAPVLIAWHRWGELRGRLTRQAVLEGAVLLALLLVVATLALGPRRDWVLQPAPYTAFPLLFWASLRFGPVGATTSALIVAAVATWFASLGVGPFAAAGASSVSVALHVYTFLIVVSLSSLIPGAVLEERRAAEQRLRESEERYRTVVDAANDGIITIDENSRIGFANPAAERIFGYPVQEMFGRSLTMLMPTDARERHLTSLARYIETGEKHIEWRGVALTGIHKDGHQIPLEVSFGELAENGRHSFTGIVRDVSERTAAEAALRDAENRMRFAMDASRVGTWELEYATGKMRWSQTLEALHGLEQGAFGGTLHAFLALIHHDDRDAVRLEIDRAARQRTNANILYRAVWADRTVRWISGVGQTFYSSVDEPVRAVGIGLDVTERRALEEQYRQAQKMEAIGHLAGGVAHDFNNLLTAIQGFGFVVAESLPAADVRRADVNEILRAAERAASLTRQLLAFSRQQILAPRVLSLAESVRAMQPMLRRLIGEDIEVIVRAANETGSIRADPGQMEQVILNLALNARDAMPNGGTLLIEVSNVSLEEDYVRQHIEVKAGRYVMLALTDSGVGMDADTASRVFEPFFTTKPMGEGTGLGLSTVYGIVKQSGGSVLVYSEVGRGSTFKVYLPRVESEGGTPVPDTTATEASPAVETVLVVEDDPAIRSLARRILEKQGYAVLLAGTPNEAIDVAARHSGPIELLLTDVVLPEMSGRALAEQLMQRRPELRVVYMSGYSDDAVVQRGVLERATQFIQKPFGPEALFRKVREVLNMPRE
ncbi:MAG: MASE1 domain-containing protein [Gemmatimonadaceae bacterium]